MGTPLIDLLAFQPEIFHRRLGLNLLVPTLPLHGPRKSGRRSGDGFLSGDPLDTLHAEAQAMWDLRRLLGWLREDQAAAPDRRDGLLARRLQHRAARLARRRARLCDRRHSGHGLHAHLLPAPAAAARRERGAARARRVDAARRAARGLAARARAADSARAALDLRRRRRSARARRSGPRSLASTGSSPGSPGTPAAISRFRLHPSVPKLVLTALVDSGLST